ncbi:hypothetical protein JW710_01390 [Candidatus Dojkabacteria bacterium]|nr:hypothetical protein [Candidatus Dojkabacteria bacterium]
MRCSFCKKTAVAICRFCGRGLCDDHKKCKPYVSAAYDENRDDPKFIVVEDAMWCGKCNPVMKPIEMPEAE